MSDKVVWSWKDDYDWVVYDNEATQVIETAYAKWFADKKQSNICELNFGFYKNQGGYSIDFKTMKQTKKRTSYKRNVKREGPPPVAQPKLNSKQRDALTLLFEKYKALGIKLSDSGETGDWIKGDGFIKYQADLDIKEDDDPGMLFILWKLGVKTGDTTTWVIPRDVFMKGWDLLGISDVAGMKKYLTQLRKDLKSKDDEFRKFYKWIFQYMKEEKSILPIDEATAVWELIGINNKTWPLMDQWLEFLKKQNSITLDTWNMFYNFTKQCPKDISSFDPNDLWPTMIDDFVESLNPDKKNVQEEEEEED